MLAWLDIETTGLHPKTYSILEIGFVLTDDDLNEIKRRAWVLPFAGRVDDFIAKMHGPVEEGGSGLLSECRAVYESSPRNIEGYAGPVSLEHAADVRYGNILYAIKDWLVDNVPGKPPLCGSTVDFDRGFLRERTTIPLEDLFHYRVIDVSTVKEMARRWASPVYESRPGAGAKHRALSDLDDTIAEARHYKKFFFSGHEE